MKMKKVVSMGALILSSSLALAGSVQPRPVLIELEEDGSGTAYGDMVSARFSDNDVELIGCGMRSYADGYVHAFCQATGADETSVICVTENPYLIESLARLSDYSFIIFYWNADGECTFVGSSTQSFYLPAN